MFYIHTLVLYVCRYSFCLTIRCSIALLGSESPPSKGTNFHSAVEWFANLGGQVERPCIMASSALFASSREVEIFKHRVISGRLPGRGHTSLW